MVEGFIDELTRHITTYVPDNPDWVEACAIATFSAFLEGIQFTTVKGKLNLNLFFLCIAPSSIGNKSVPLKNFARDILYRASEEFEKTGIQKGLLLPDKFTVEALIKHFATISNNGIIVADEFTAMIKSSKRRYLANLMEFLSQLYDGEAQSRTTIRNGLVKSEKCYVSFISATTPYIYSVLKQDLFIQGTGNRFLYILYDNPKFKE